MSELIAPCVRIDVSEQNHDKFLLSPSHINSFEEKYGRIGKGSFVLVHTGWDKFWPSQENYINNHVFPSISSEAAQLLLERDIVGIGIDTPSPDINESSFPVHHLILGAGKYILENIKSASQLPILNSYILILPIKTENGTEAPIRLVGLK